MTMLNGKPIDNPIPSTGTPPARTVSAVVSGSEVTVAAGDRQVGLVLGLSSLIAAFVFPVAGFVLGLVALSMSRRAGEKNPLALAGTILGILFSVIIIVIVVVSIVFGIGLFSAVIDVCQQLGTGTHEYHGVTYTCG